MKTKFINIELFFYLTILFIACEKDPEFNQGKYEFENYNLTIYSNPIDTIDIPTVNNDSITINELNNTMVFVEGGSFWMGAQKTNISGNNYDNEAATDESPVHYVTLSSFYIGKFEVTQKQWKAVMGSNPSYFIGDNLPVEQVSWNDIQEFIQKLNNKTGYTYRLPTEAQWEFAARGGKYSNGYKYSGSNAIDQVAWYVGNSSSKTHTVGTKLPNELGIYDMSGNVFEWCQDWDGTYSSSVQTNPQGASSGSYRVCRGGTWGGSAFYCRVFSRGSGDPDNPYYGGYGFRLCRVQ